MQEQTCPCERRSFHILHRTLCLSSSPALLCCCAVMWLSGADRSSQRDTHVLLMTAVIMAMERKPGYILLQLTKILLCPTSKYMFLSKKYRCRYHDTGIVFPHIGLVPSFAVLPVPRLCSSPNVLHMKKMYFLFFFEREAWLCQDFTEGLHERAQVLFFPLTTASLFLQSKTDCCFLGVFCFFFTFLQQLCFFPENFTLPLGQPSS